MNKHNYNIQEIGQLLDRDRTDVSRRVLYLKPNRYSDEAIAVGVLIKHEGGYEFEYVASNAAYEALNCFYGGEVAEQLLFSLNLLKRKIHSDDVDFDKGLLPTDLLGVGPVSNVTCENPKIYARDYLQLASSLYRTYDCSITNDNLISQDRVRDDLYRSVGLIDTFSATRLFKGEKIKYKDKRTIEVPIVGDRIFGAPVSFVTKMVANATIRAEAYIAEFSFVRNTYTDKQSILYVLIPSISKTINQKLVDQSLEKLQTIASANNVKLRCEKDINELAKVLLSDEAA